MGKIVKNAKTGHPDYFDNSGNNVPSVTTVIKILGDNQGLLGWANSLGFKRISLKNEQDKNINIGNLVHGYIHHYFTDEKIEDDESKYNSYELDVAEKCYTNFKRWFKTIKDDFELIYSEKSFVYNKLGYGGTIDLYGIYKDEYILYDFKTSRYFNKSFFIQLAAYKYMMEAKKKRVDKVAIVRLNKSNNEVSILIMNSKQIKKYFELFKLILQFFKLNKEVDIDWKEESKEFVSDAKVIKSRFVSSKK